MSAGVSELAGRGYEYEYDGYEFGGRGAGGFGGGG